MNTNTIISKFEDKDNVIFDLDETLLTLNIDWLIWKNFVDKTLLKYDPDFKINSIVKYAHTLNEFSDKFGNNFTNEITNLTIDFESKYLIGYTVNKNAIKLLEILVDKRIYIWTSNTHKVVTRILAELSLLDKIKMVVARDNVSKIKPDTEGFCLINKDDYPVESFIFIGDSSYDIEVSEKIGMQFLHISEIAS